MNLRRVASAAVLAAALTGAALTAPPADAAVPQSTVCTALGSCVTVTNDKRNRYTVRITCKASELIFAGVRGYASNGDWATSPVEQVTCAGPGDSPAPFTKTYVGSTLVGHRARLGPWPKLGPYAGQAVPAGGREIRPGHGFHWD